MMKKHIIYSHYLLSGLLALMSLVLSVSCDDSDLVRQVDPQIEIQEDLFTSPSASRQVLMLHSTYPWFAEASTSWIKLQRYRGQSLKPDSIIAEIEENPSMEPREGWIEIRLMDQMSKRIPVKQSGRGSLITLSKKLIYFNINGGEVTLDVYTDLEWTSDVQQADGFTFTKVDKNHLKVKVDKNTTGSERRKVVTLTDTDKKVKAELMVIQTNVDKMLSISLTPESKDVVLSKAGEEIHIPVSLNIAYDCISSDNSWIKITETPSFSGDIVQDMVIKATIEPNAGNEERSGYIIIKDKSADSKVSDVFYVSQRAKSRIVYVKAGASGGDGTSWERPFGTFEEGLAACADYGDMELWVAEGRYQLKNYTYLKKISTYGGFKGTEKKLKDRDLSKKSTLVAAPSNTWPSVYANVLNAGVTCYMDGFLFTGSKATQGEGGIAVWGGWVFRNCIISDNTCYKNAGGLFEHAKLINCLFHNNTTGTSSAVVVALDTELYNVTIVNNKGGGSSGGLRINGTGKTVLYNTVIWGNVHLAGNVHQVYLDANGNSKFVNCAVQGGFVFNGNNKPSSISNCITLDTDNASTSGPRFVDVNARNYQLQSNSPLINAGDNTSVGTQGLLNDIIGGKRIWGDRVDIGAFEYQSGN